MRYVLACSVALLVLPLVGCGGKKASSNGEASKSAKQIVADVQQAVKGAKSVHVVGAGVSSGSKLTIDMTYDTSATGGGSGHISIDGLGFDIARINGKTYFKGDANFLTHFAGSQAAKLMGGKWFYVSSSDTDFASLAELANLTSLTSAILSVTGTITKGAQTSIDGQPAIALDDSDNGGTLYVSTTGPAYPLELEPGSGNGSGTIKFENWDKSVTLTAPKNPINYDKLVAQK